MSASFDVIIRFLEEGKPEAALVALKEYKAAYAQATEEIKKHREETGHATHSASELKQIVNGLRHEFPELAHALHLALHPLSLFVASVGAAVVGTVEYIQHVNEMERASQEFDTIGDRVESLARIQLELNEATRAFERDLGDVQAALHSVTAQEEQWIAALKRRSDLAKESGEAQLAEDLERIALATERGTLSTVAGIEAKSKAEEAARQRKRQGEIEDLQNERAAAERAKAVAENDLTNQNAGLSNRRGELPEATRAASVAAEQAKAEDENLKKRKEIAEAEKTIMERFAEGKAGPEDVLALGKIKAERQLKFGEDTPAFNMFSPHSREAAAQRVEALERELKETATMAQQRAQAAEAAQSKVKDLQETITRLEKTVKDTETAKANAEKTIREKDQALAAKGVVSDTAALPDRVNAKAAQEAEASRQRAAALKEQREMEAAAKAALKQQYEQEAKRIGASGEVPEPTQAAIDAYVAAHRAPPPPAPPPPRRPRSSTAGGESEPAPGEPLTPAGRAAMANAEQALRGSRGARTAAGQHAWIPLMEQAAKALENLHSEDARIQNEIQAIKSRLDHLRNP